MASHWIDQIAAGNEIPELDLSLKLALPQEAHKNTNLLNPLPLNPLPNPRQGGSTYRPSGGHGSHEYQYRMAEKPINAGFGNNFPFNSEGKIDYDRGSYQYSKNMINPLSARVENHLNMVNNRPRSSMKTANLNPSGHNTATFAFPSPPITDEYTLIDTPAQRNRKIEIHHPYLDGFFTVTVDRIGICRQCTGPYSELNRTTDFNSFAMTIDQRGVRRQRTRTYHVPKRCTNFNCGTTETPMWRRGPLGPKTLCNACGIKFRKEEEKRKAKEASKSSG